MTEYFMKIENKRRILLAIFAVLFSMLIFISSVSAVETSLNYSSSNKVQVRSLKYEPYPVTPGEYFEVWISVQTIGTNVGGWVFELDPDYPFSLDDGEDAVQDFGSVSSPSLLLKYNVRVDEDAYDGTYDLNLKYKVGGVEYVKPLEIDVEDSRTDFDAVIQDTSDDEVSIAIANVGKYTANAVVVKIPEQDDFQATDTSGQMVGNLDAGDYTIVSFSVSAVMQRTMQSEGDEGSMPNFSGQESSDTNLQFDIYYTDELGERRVVNMELPLSMSSENMTFDMSGMEGDFSVMRSRNSFWASWYVRSAIIFIILVIAFFIYKRYPRQTKKLYEDSKDRVEELFKKKKHDNSREIPDWIKNHNGKKK